MDAVDRGSVAQEVARERGRVADAFQIVEMLAARAIRTCDPVLAAGARIQRQSIVVVFESSGATLHVQPSTGHRPLLWFLLAYALMILNDVLYIRWSGWIGFLIVDYGTRLIVLALLTTPALRSIAFRDEPLKVPQIHAWIFILGCILLDRIFAAGLLQILSLSLGTTRLFHFPDLPPGIREADLFIGTFLVAWSEELLCRRCAKIVLRRYLRSDSLLIVVSALMFAAAHWSHGVPSMIYITLTGGIMMAVYLQVGALWPLVVAHYIIDVIAFW